MGALDAERLAQFLEDHPENCDPIRWAMIVSEPSFAAVWDNPEDAVYDAL